jgi:uncharacterized membrane protein YGL010W
MEDKTNIPTKYAELHTSNKTNVHIILISVQYILMKVVVVVAIMMMITTTVTICNIWVFSIANNLFCIKIPLPWLSTGKYKQPTTNRMHNYKIVITVRLC